MGIFKFNKHLPNDVTTKMVIMEENIDVVFEQMIYFRRELDNHTGKAANALRNMMDDHIEFFSKASVAMLNFADVLQAFVTEMMLVDEGVLACAPPLHGRLEYQYSYSADRIEEEIYLNPAGLEQATDSFQSNLESLREILASFNTMIDEIVRETHFPWDEVSSIWDESKKEVNAILADAEHRVNELIKSSDNLVEELTRVDHLISQQIQMLQ